MKKFNTDNSDVIDYFKTLEALKQHPDIKYYRKQYHDLRQEGTSTEEIKQSYSAHTTLRRLDKKRNNLLGSFISELNPIKKENTLDSAQRRSLARTLIREKSDNEIVSLVIKLRTEAALELQCAVELSCISSVLNNCQSLLLLVSVNKRHAVKYHLKIMLISPESGANTVDTIITTQLKLHNVF